jgi:hypothetical protein
MINERQDGNEFRASGIFIRSAKTGSIFVALAEKEWAAASLLASPFLHG